jgi:beta-1,2-mannobiose phosphorylase / 1,2-beta-oligomannan phosphorylase
MVDFVVEGLSDVLLQCDGPLKSMDWMSPFVWREGEALAMMMRGVPRPLGPNDPTGVIFRGQSRDGLTFTMDPRPSIEPGPNPVDGGGVEDPTVEVTSDGIVVFYTGVELGRTQGALLAASGPDAERLAKRAVLLQAPEGQGNIKEATLAQATDGSWRLFYEFAREDASRIGVAKAGAISDPWVPVSEPVPIREGSWDNWHLSTGPIVTLPGRDPVMFYNGATHDARWRIGWVTFDAAFTKVTDRCVEPLLVPPPAEDRFATDIAFAASAVVTGNDSLDLYYSLGDRTLSRASIKAYG